MSFAAEPFSRIARAAPARQAFGARFIAGTALLGALAGAAANWAPQLAPALMAANGALIAWRFLHGDPARLILPALFAIAGLVLLAVCGLGGLAAAFVAWRWLDAGLESQAHARAYRRAGGDKALDPEPYSSAHFWLTPIWGLVYRLSEAAPHPALSLLSIALGVAALVALFAWALRRLAEWRLGELAAPHAAYVAVHHAMFVLGYVLTPDIVAGLILVDLWRNAQDTPFIRARN